MPTNVDLLVAQKSKPTRVMLTDKYLRKLPKKPAKPGKRYVVWDVVVPNFGVRVSDRGHCTFIVGGRFGATHYSRREIDQVGALTLVDARAKARRWLEADKAGKDPRLDEQKTRRDQLRKNGYTVESVAEAFIEHWVIGDPAKPRQRQHKEVSDNIRKHLVSTWGHRPVTDIERGDILTLISSKKGTPAAARNLLGYCKSFFDWALHQDYGLKFSPAADIKPIRIIGEKIARDHTLNDDEVKALWAVADAIGYPAGPAYKLLLLTGCRLNEIARAQWGEVDLEKRQWIIPAARMKGKNHKAKPHLVPITQDMATILDSLPRFKGGDFLFSTTYGKKPISLGSKLKTNIDKQMRERLSGKFRPWRTHDLRRVVRSGLAALKIADPVAEAILAHVQPGIKGNYNVYQYGDEKCEALKAWGAKVREIITPPPDPSPNNVVRLANTRA